jgi:hypothetical protein
MKIRISQTEPTTKPIREYETRFIYIGFKYRYDTHTKMISFIERHADGSTTYTERYSDTSVFSRAYSSEHTRVRVYSESPRIWSEETSPTEMFVFTELQE